MSGDLPGDGLDSEDYDIMVSRRGKLKVIPMSLSRHLSIFGKDHGDTRVVLAAAAVTFLAGLIFVSDFGTGLRQGVTFTGVSLVLTAAPGGVFLLSLGVCHLYLLRRSAWIVTGVAVGLLVVCTAMSYLLDGPPFV